VPISRLFYTDAFFLAYLATTLTLAYVVFRFFERPVQNYLRARMRGAEASGVRPELLARDP